MKNVSTRSFLFTMTAVIGLLVIVSLYPNNDNAMGGQVIRGHAILPAFLTVRVQDIAADLSLPGATVKVFSTSGELLASRITDNEGKVKIRISHPEGSTVRVVATKTGYTSHSREMDVDGSLEWLFLMPEDEWVEYVPIEGGVFTGPDGGITLAIPPDTFGEPVVLKYRSVPPEASSCPGLDFNIDFPVACFSLSAYLMDGSKREGPLNHSIFVTMFADDRYTDDPSSLFAGGGNLFIMDEWGLVLGGQQILAGSVDCDEETNQLGFNLPHLTMVTVAGEAAGGGTCGVDVSGSYSCTNIGNGTIDCGTFWGLPVNRKFVKGSTIGGSNAVVAMVAACLGVANKEAAGKLAAQVGASATTDGGLAIAQTCSTYIENGDRLANECMDGTVTFFEISKSTHVQTTSGASGVLTFPTGWESCLDVHFAQHCCPETPEFQPVPSKGICCGNGGN